MEIVRSLPAGGETMETIAEMLEQRGYEKAVKAEKYHWVSEGEQRGEQRGELKKSRDLLLRNISARFGTINRDIVERITSIQSVEILDGLFDLSLRASSFDEFKEQVIRATDN